MAHLIDKDAVLAIIEQLKDEAIDMEDKARWFLSAALARRIEDLEVKEVDLELITGWFDHIAQIADDRMTLTNQRMTDAHALDEIKCLAKNSSEFITKHYKAQKA